jgi:hypothetical protein
MLVAQGDYVFVALAEGSHTLQSTLRLRQHTDRTVAINRVPVIGKIPAAAFAGRTLGHVRIHGWLRRKAVGAMQ